MQTMTSLTWKTARKKPGIAPQSIPQTVPVRIARTHTRTPSAGFPFVSMFRATRSEPVRPIRNCPAAPMLKSPVLYAMATETPVMMSGVA